MATPIPGLEMITVTKFTLCLKFPSTSLLLQLPGGCQNDNVATFNNKSVGGGEEKVKVNRETENGIKRISSVSRIWSRKFYDPNDLEKQNQNA